MSENEQSEFKPSKISPEYLGSNLEIAELDCSKSDILKWLKIPHRIAYIVGSNFRIYLRNTNLHDEIRKILGYSDSPQIAKNEIGDGIIILSTMDKKPLIDVTLNQSLNENDPIYNAPFEDKDMKSIENIIVDKIRQYLAQ